MLIDIHRNNTLQVGEPVDDVRRIGSPARAAIERREDAIVKNLLASESPVCVLVMGGDHDLADNLERIAGGTVEYVRVQVNGYRRKAAGE